MASDDDRRRWQLAKLRKLRGFSQPKLAGLVHVSPQTVSRWETGASEIDLDNLQPLADALEVTLQRLHRVLRNEDPDLSDELEGSESAVLQRLMPEWLTAYVGQEQSASKLQSYEPHVVHGLLQTRDYAHVVASESDYARGRGNRTERLVKLRLRRQAALTREIEPLELELVISETALRTKVDGRETMHHQLRHIADMTDLPNVTIYVLPFGSGYHNATRGSFTLLTFPWEGETEPTSAYTESYLGASYLDNQIHVDQFASLFKRLRQMSLSPSDSIRFIHQVAEEYVR